MEVLKKHAKLIKILIKVMIIVGVFLVAVNWAMKPQELGAFAEVRVDRLAFTGEYRQITMYNAGDPNQTDSTPCMSANGENVCQTTALGYKRIATNREAFGTCLFIEGMGEYMVVDRMNRRYDNGEIDIAMQAHEKDIAIKFGAPKMRVIQVECGESRKLGLK